MLGCKHGVLGYNACEKCARDSHVADAPKALKPRMPRARKAADSAYAVTTYTVSAEEIAKRFGPATVGSMYDRD